LALRWAVLRGWDRRYENNIRDTGAIHMNPPAAVQSSVGTTNSGSDVSIAFTFGKSGGANAYLEAGWESPEANFVWGSGLESDLILPIGSAHALQIEVYPHLAGVRLPQQRLSVLSDGVEVVSASLTKDRGALKFCLPPSNTKNRHIIFRHPDARAPQELSNTSDGRQLAVALVRISANFTEAAWELIQDEMLVPPAKLLFDGADSQESFRQLGVGFTNVNLIARGQLKPNERVLDLGSGNGQKARVLTRYLRPEGTYVGLDVVREGVLWCQERYAPFPNFRFEVADIHSSHYNPTGGLSPSNYRLPYPDADFDLVFLASVFTHMLPPEVANYTREISRVLKPGGRCVASYFLINEETVARLERGEAQFDFVTASENCRVLDAKNQSRAVALDEHWVRRQWNASGMNVVEMTFGFWAGCRDLLGALQDVIITVKCG
jgi:SAM-dependent methyltransferase